MILRPWSVDSCDGRYVTSQNLSSWSSMNQKQELSSSDSSAIENQGVMLKPKNLLVLDTPCDDTTPA